MVKVFFQGFLFGLAYVAPIGAQNLYVINSAVAKNKLSAYQTALITIFFDITLALACFFGVGIVLSRFGVIKNIVMLIGCVAVVYIGINLIKSVPKKAEESQVNHSFLKVVSICFAVTWLNPQAIIDGTLLLGGIQASLAAETSKYFIFGTAFASFMWFMSLTTIVVLFKNVLTVKVLRYINIVCGSVIIFYGIKLGYALINMN
jgi:L-lysine exporter family protein LysE/ArgO